MKKASSGRKIRLTALGVLLLSAVLLTGAGRVGDNLQSRRRIREENREAMNRVLHTVLAGIVEKRKDDPLQLQKLVAEEPELVMSLLCSDLKTVSRH